MPPQSSRFALLIVFLTVFIDLLGFGIVLPLLPVYGKAFAGHLTDSAQGWIVGLLMASFSAMQFLFLPIWGRLSDHIGRRPVILLGLTGSTVFYSLFGLATLWHSLTWLFVARIGAGISGATISTAQAYIADVTTAERRAKGMALIGAAFALGFTFGPLIGAGAVLVGGSRVYSPWPGFVAAAMSALALVLAFLKLPEPERYREPQGSRGLVDISSVRRTLAIPSVGLLILASFVTVVSFASFESTLSLEIAHIIDNVGASDGTSNAWLVSHFVERSNPVETAASTHNGQATNQVVLLGVFTYVGIVLALTQGFLVRRLATRISEATMAGSGGAMCIVGFVLLAYACQEGHFVLLLVATAIEVIGFAFVNPSLQALISRRTAADEQGGVLGISQSASSLARILGPIYGVRLFAEGPAFPYWGAAVIMVIGWLLILVSSRRGTDAQPSAN